jgi:fibronectin-binding autotransporter adhesin
MPPRKMFMVLMVVSSLGHAQTFTWDGGGADDNFGTPANWNPDGNPSVGSGVILRFTGSTRTTPNNNYTSGDDFGEWRLFSGAGADFTIGGNSFDLFSKIEVDSGVGRNLTLNTGAINAGANIEINPVGGNITLGSGTAVELHNNRTLNVYDGNFGRTLTINGTLSNGNGTGGNGSLILNQTSTVVLAGSSNDYGNTTINSGTTLRVGDGGANGSLGSGTVSNSGTLTFNRGSGSSYNQGATVTGTGTFRVQSGTVVGTVAGSFGGSGAKVDIQSGGAINLNGVNRGSNLFDVTLAGTGNGGSGAIFNTGAALAGNSGIRNVTLAANASIDVGGTGDTRRVDLRNDGTINLAGFTLSKTGTGILYARGTYGSAGTYQVSQGHLAFENNAPSSATVVDVQAGAGVGAFGGMTVPATIRLNGSTAAIYSHAVADNTFSGPVTLVGGGLVDLSDRVHAWTTGSSINLTGAMSGTGGPYGFRGQHPALRRPDELRKQLHGRGHRQRRQHRVARAL